MKNISQIDHFIDTLNKLNPANRIKHSELIDQGNQIYRRIPNNDIYSNLEWFQGVVSGAIGELQALRESENAETDIIDFKTLKNIVLFGIEVGIDQEEYWSQTLTLTNYMLKNMHQ